ncbi:MAG: hypothetical protein EOM24_02725 [Chloroflexia bacterium]|nr:hypothetical protein [Chloroflexia bacterium]
MHRTIDVIIHADGTIEPLEPLAVSGSQRALLTILEHAPADGGAVVDDNEAIDALLLAAGLQDIPEDILADLEPLSEEAVDALWMRIPAGTPLSQLVIEDREETF